MELVEELEELKVIEVESKVDNELDGVGVIEELDVLDFLVGELVELVELGFSVEEVVVGASVEGFLDEDVVGELVVGVSVEEVVVELVVGASVEGFSDDEVVVELVVGVSVEEVVVELDVVEELGVSSCQQISGKSNWPPEPQPKE